jgi:hypothetical protein
MRGRAGGRAGEKLKCGYKIYKNINTEFKRLHRFKGKPPRISEDVEELAIQGQFNCLSITSPTTPKAESRKRTSKFNLETSKSCRLLLD